MKISDYFYLSIVSIFLVATCLLLIASRKPYSKNLRVVACDVGQGDGFIIIHGHTQAIIDGGAGNRLRKCLEKHTPFFDRTIELMVNTHPQKDHYEGLIDILKVYEVEYFVGNEIESSEESYRVLKDLVGRRVSQLIVAPNFKTIGNSLISFDLLWPTSTFINANSRAENGRDGDLGSRTTSIDPNDFSIVVGVHYKDFDALFTGDIPPHISDQLAKDLLESDYELLKVPHHGSRNGLTESLLKALKVEVAFIGVGKNTYGHPHKEVLELLEKYHIKTKRTDIEGDIILAVQEDGSVILY